MRLLRKHWRHFNMVGALATFIFGTFWMIWGSNAEAPYNQEIGARINAATEIETLRSECHEMNAKIKFAHDAGLSLGQIELVFLCFVFTLFALNIRLVKGIEITDNTNTPPKGS